MRWTSCIPEGVSVQSGRVGELVREFACFGSLASGGVARLCASAADGEARDRLGVLLNAAGADVTVDAVGNQFGLFRLAEHDDAPLVMMGSHLDSQPRGGRIDGTLGVMAALEVGQLLIAAKQQGHVFQRNFCLVNWTNEEGARFRPSLLGSGVFAGHYSENFALACRDDDGVTLKEALVAIGYHGSDPCPSMPEFYIELHAEQGPRLETAGCKLGLVTGNWGAAKLDLIFEGEQAHTGPTPMTERRDALLAASRIIDALRQLADSVPDLLHTSVGRIVVSPNSSNVVADRAEFTAEIRSPDDHILKEAEARFQQHLDDVARSTRTVLRRGSQSLRPARSMPMTMVQFLEGCGRALGANPMRLDTVSGHDALSLLGLCQTALVFLPSIGGIAHNEAEATDDADMDIGTSLLLEAAFRLCGGETPSEAPQTKGGA
ncbi:M20 family metallo-hydrolase [Rhizobium sp.]|jgi:beta-ureidopropionase / N-carbamoyl-L-amino-acid hydrolase|uniref:M20 family metallo-hydrolase n=1 Tax=Rhizobium sp. TaxID=391 RepID=UPI000E88A4FB|nr:Zn-dependent hydrolase [Rhizobium sp.]